MHLIFTSKLEGIIETVKYGDSTQTVKVNKALNNYSTVSN